MTFGTRVGVTTGTGEVATTTGGGKDLTPIQTRIGGRDGGVAGPVTVGGSMTMVVSVDPVTTVASVDPAIMAEATTAGVAATAKPLPAQVTVAAPWVSVI